MGASLGPTSFKGPITSCFSSSSVCWKTVGQRRRNLHTASCKQQFATLVIVSLWPVVSCSVPAPCTAQPAALRTRSLSSRSPWGAGTAIQSQTITYMGPTLYFSSSASGPCCPGIFSSRQSTTGCTSCKTARGRPDRECLTCR